MKETKKKSFGFGKVLDVLIIIANFLFISFFALVIYFTISYWKEAFMAAIGLTAKFFWAGILLAVVNACLEFVRYSINTNIKAFKRIKDE